MSEALELTVAGLVAAHAIVAVAGLVHGTLGLGFPRVATPLLALLVDARRADFPRDLFTRLYRIGWPCP